MTDTSLSRDAALRIGLAARVLPDMDIPRLLRLLGEAVGRPPTVEKLNHLRLSQLRQAAGGELDGLDTAALKQAMAYLNGQVVPLEDAPPPPLEDYMDGDLPQSVRVACASNGGEQLDGHFGSCGRFLIYQVNAGGCRLIDVRVVDSLAPVEDKNSYRAALIGDCHLLYVVSIGGPAAAKVIRQGLHPVKQPEGGHARTHMLRLSRVLAGPMPPWLAKIQGQTPEQRVRFALEAEA